MDVGETPFIADTAAVREQPRHPAFRRVAQATDDKVDVIVRLARRTQRFDVVEVDDGNAHVDPPGWALC